MTELARQILLLSGPIAVGKSRVVGFLLERALFVKISSGKFLSDYAKRRNLGIARQTLQDLGDQLDLATDYRWLIDDVAVPALNSKPEHLRWLVDAVRKRRQVEHFRATFGNQVVHVHLVAEEELLRNRYDDRLLGVGDYEGNLRYDLAVQHPNEVAARSLSEIADHVIDTSGLLPEHVALGVLRLFGQDP